MRNVPRLEFFVSSLLVSRALVYLQMVLVLLLLVAAETGRYMVNTNFEGRQRFDTLPHRMLTCFVLFTGDNWSEIMVKGMAWKTTAFGHLVVALYILAWVATSVFVLANLAMAIIIETFQVSDLLVLTRRQGICTCLRRLFRQLQGLVRPLAHATRMKETSAYASGARVHKPLLCCASCNKVETLSLERKCHFLSLTLARSGMHLHVFMGLHRHL